MLFGKRTDRSSERDGGVVTALLTPGQLVQRHRGGVGDVEMVDRAAGRQLGHQRFNAVRHVVFFTIDKVLPLIGSGS